MASNNDDTNTNTNQAYEEAMDDVHTRFILNLPDEELQSAPRIFFQLEQAWWFYDDFICDGAAAKKAAAAAAEKEEEGEGVGESYADKLKKSQNKNDNKEETLPRFKHVKPFSLAMFKFSPLLSPMLPQFDKMYGEFTTYKRSISTYGTILLNKDATKMALCRVYKGKSWTLPGGKVNQNESGKDAAARETYEETGFDPQSERGICAKWLEMRERGEEVDELINELGDNSNGQDKNTADEEDDDALLLPWKPLQDTGKLVYTENETNKRRTCYVCRGVPESFPFEPVARKEVSEVSWHDITNLPKHTYAVLPFMTQLRKWIKRDNRKRGIVVREKSRSGSRPKGQSQQQPQSTPNRILKKPRQQEIDEEEFGLTPFFSDEGNAPWEEDEDEGAGIDALVDEEDDEETGKNKKEGRASSNKKERKQQRDKSSGKKGRAGSKQRANSRSGSRANSRASSCGRQVDANDPLVQSALASPGESNRWTEDEMFATNEQILGRKITYDGNPHDFAEKGFDVVGEGRVDPHAFRVVGGTFMNSAEGGVLSAPPEASALQPLINTRARSGSRGSNVSGLSGDHTDGEMTGGGGNNDNDDDDMVLTPFFTDDGKAPWEEGALGGILPLMGADAAAAAAAKEQHITPPPVRSAQSSAGQSNSKGLALLSKLRQGTSANDEVGDDKEAERLVAVASKNQSKNAQKDKNKKGNKTAAAVDDRGTEIDTNDDWFMTDKEITAKSQKEKLSILPPSSFVASEGPPPTKAAAEAAVPPAQPTQTALDRNQQNNEHFLWMKQWVQQLPQSRPTKEFGDFRLDVNAVMNAMTLATK